MYPINWGGQPFRDRAGIPVGNASGFDIRLEYKPPRKRAGFDIVQHITTKRTYRIAVLTNECTADVGEPTQVAIERFRQYPASDVLWAYYRPESDMRVVYDGIVAYVELPRPPAPPGFKPPRWRLGDPQHQVAFLNMTNPPGGPGPTYLDGLPDDAQREEFTDSDRMKEASYLQYQLIYEYDGCHNPPDPYDTICGEQHCVKLRWWHVENGRQGNSQSKSWEGIGTRNCPEL